MMVGVKLGEGVRVGVSVERGMGGVSVGGRGSAPDCEVGVGGLASMEPQAARKTNAAKTQAGGPGLRRSNRLSLVI